MPTFSLALLPHPGHCVEGRVTSLPQAAWGLTAAVPSALPGCVGTHRRGHAVSQPLRSHCSWGEANDSGTLRGVRPGPDSGLGPVLQDGRPPRFESHILINSWVTDSPPRGQVGGWRGLRRAERQRPARGGAGAGAHVTAEREMGGSVRDSALPVCIQAPRPGAPLERGALGGATKHTGACPQRSHVGAGRRCTDLGAERD